MKSVDMRKGIAAYIVFVAVFLIWGRPVWATGDYPYDPAKDRDPMRPLINERGQFLLQEDSNEARDIFLQGIMYSEKNSQAVINNELVGAGDSIAGYTVKKIDAKTVVLEKNGKVHVIKWEGVYATE